MNAKEVVNEAFDLGEPERVPATLFGGGVWTIFNSGNNFLSFKGKPEKYAEVVLETQRKLDSDIVYMGSGYNNFHAAALGGKMKMREVGAPDLEAPLVNEPEDLEELDLLGVDEDDVIATVRDATRIVAKNIGDEFAVTVTAWGPFTLAAQLRGVERLMFGIYKQPDFVRKITDFSAEVVKKFYQPLIDDGVIEMVSIAEPTASGDLISRKHFEEFALPTLKKMIGDFKAKGVSTLLHICGNTRDKIDLIGNTGADCFSMDSKVDLAFAKEQLEGKMCIAGNVDPVAVMSLGGAEGVRKASEKCIHAAASGGGYVLMPGCDIPHTVPYDNIKALMEVAKG
ncbi:MAG: uroporphyrinogen decarboxylase family protein [Candidatus Hydrothermarchaeales archaeon]